MRTRAATITAFALLAISTPALGQQTEIQVNEIGLEQFLELVRADVRQQRTQLVGEGMQLNAEQAAAFWPIYREYEGEVALLDEQQNQNIKNYAESFQQMTEAKANELAQTAMTIQQQRLALRKLYYDRMAGEIGSIIAARFLQIDNQLTMLVDLQIASQLPLVQGR